MASPQQTNSEKDKQNTPHRSPDNQTDFAQSDFTQPQAIQSALQNPITARPQTILQMQRLYGNRAVSNLITTSQSHNESPVQRSATAVPDIQRGIKKPSTPYSRGDNLYSRAPTRTDGKPIRPSVRRILQDIIDNDEKFIPKSQSGKMLVGTKDYTLKQALSYAEEQVASSGKFVMGRPGTRIGDADEMLKYLEKTRNADVTIAKTKFTNHADIWDDLLSTVEIVEDDFKGVNFNGSGQSVWSNFTSTITEVVPGTIHTIEGFNEVVSDMVTNDQHTGSALKGSMFEKWSLANVVPNANNRITFAKQGTLNQNRTSDGYNKTSKELWDMKHYEHKMAQGTNNNQAADYDEIVKNGYKSQEGYDVTSINYLFPSKDAAKANDWLATTYGFGVYYVKEPTTLKKYA